jgi:PKD repeat protein
MRLYFTFFLFLFVGYVTTWGQATADFSAFPLSQCNPPYEVTFENVSQGDTAWLWNFGDGNTSTFPNPIHLYTTTGTFTVTLIAYGPGGNDTLTRTNYITTSAPPADPTLNQSTDTINCGASTQFIATGAPELVWYNADDHVVARGDTLDLPIVTNDLTFYVQSEDESAPMYVGPVDPDSVGGGGIFNGNQGLIFNVLSDIKLKSVLVEAQGSGIRNIELQDTFGVILQTISIFIPDGKSRIYLDLELQPGNYRMMGDAISLFRNNSGPSYPYVLPGLVEIVNSTAGTGFYYFFYDWEVTTFCRSNKVQVDVVVNDIPGPTITQDTVTVGCGNGAELIATASNAVYWYDAGDTEVGRGDTLEIPFAGASTTYYARNVEQSASLYVGPADPDSLANGNFSNSPDNSWLTFDVAANITLVSAWVEADVAGTRDIEIVDDNGNNVATLSATLPAGKSRLNINVELEPGSYLIGGSNLGLFRNDSVTVDYPYSIPGIVSITGSSDGRDTYNFFYDWEVTTACFSGRDSVYLRVDQGPAPMVSPATVTVNCVDSAQFIGTGANVVWYDQNDNIIHEGDTLNLTNITATSTYSARNVDESATMNVGPVDGDSIGNGGYFGGFGNVGLSFDVFSTMNLKSVWVDADGAGNRDIQLRDGNNQVLQVITVNIPDGKSRVPLNLELDPGSYALVGFGLDLFRNTDGFTYPYTLGGVMSITGQVGGLGGPGGGPAYFYFYDWEVSSLCKSDPSTVSVTVSPIQPPTVGMSSITIPCKGTGSISATASDNVVWYDANNSKVFVGGTYNLPPLLNTTTFFARNETNATSVFGGPADNTFGGGGLFNFAGRWQVFDVLRTGQLQTVKVFAGSAGNRTIEYRDASGNILDSVTVFVPAGESRVSLGFTLQVGTNHQLGVSGATIDLYRNNDGTNYPYAVGNYVSITGSNAGNPTGFYYFFYDWEISDPGCRSAAVPVTVNVTPLAAPSLTTPDTVCWEESATFTTSSASASWYDPNGNFIGVGKTLNTPPLTVGGTYSAKGESLEAPQYVGPLSGASVGGGGYFDQGTQARLEFTVSSPMRLNSAWVDAGSDGVRDFLLEDANGNLIETRSVFVPAGVSRVNLGFEIQPGDYQIGGQNMDLFRNNNGANYPYEIPGLVSITGSSATPAFYYFLYDWEIQEIPCASNDVTFDVFVNPVIVSSFSYVQSGAIFNFNNTSPQGSRFNWDFGDGNSSTLQNASHTYSASGTYIVTLTIFEGSCEGVFSDTVIVPSGMFIDELLASSFTLFPNPGSGSFTVQAESEQLSDMQVVVFDLMGHELFATPIQKTARFEEQIDLSKFAAGTYLVQLRVDGAQIMRKYVLTK